MTHLRGGSSEYVLASLLPDRIEIALCTALLHTTLCNRWLLGN